MKLLQEQCAIGEGYQLAELIEPHPVVAFPEDPLRVVVSRMAETGYTRLPVVNRESPQKLVGIISLNDLLKARTRNIDEERHRERVLRIRFFNPNKTATAKPTTDVEVEEAKEVGEAVESSEP